MNERELDKDWFQSIRDKLNWNARNMQKPYENRGSDSTAAARARSSSATVFRNGDYLDDVDDDGKDVGNGKDNRKLPPDTATGSPI